MTDNNKKNENYFKPPAKLLVIDDSHLNRSFIISAFTEPNYDVVAAVDGEEGIKIAKEVKPELILLDVMMPGINGFETADILKSDDDTKNIPIIFITALDAIKDKLKAFDSGAVDFVTKPFNHKELIARVRTNIKLLRVIKQNENMYHIAMEEKRNSAIARIAAGVSHNFNNMLGVSFGNIMLVDTILGNDLDQTAMEALRDVRKSLERMQTLVKQFLVLANRSSETKDGNPSPGVINLNKIVNEVISNLKSQKSNASVPLDVNCTNNIPEGCLINFDTGHLREIFQLILNEIVDITVGRSTIELSASESADSNISCIINIKGIKVPEATEVSVFEPFALPIANVGSGLSFSVAKHLVEMNDGSIKAEFPADEHMLFNLTFPKGEKE